MSARLRTGLTRRILNTTLYQLDSGYWEDARGTIYALPDPNLGVDDHDQAGVWIFRMPKDHFLSQAAPMHDYMFTSPVFQQYYTMAEANLWFLRNAAIVGKASRSKRFWLWVARVALEHFGAAFWDNKKTIKARRKIYA